MQKKLATLLEGVGFKKVKVNSKNVFKSFLVDFCCKVGVNYGFNSASFKASKLVLCEKKALISSVKCLFSATAASLLQLLFSQSWSGTYFFKLL